MNKKPISIAIDGPVCSGKGTLAIALAKKLKALYINTGAMYRGLALNCFRNKIDVEDEKKVLEDFNKTSIELKQKENGARAILNGEDVTDEIFQPIIGRLVSIVAAHSIVRKEMVVRQKKMVREAMEMGRNIVMEGRDITTDVIPDADMKIYLTADVKKRAKRRLGQFIEKGIDTGFDDVLKDLKERDRMDTQRAASPLRKAPDAIEIDTTNDTIGQTVNKVMEKMKEKNLI